MSEIHVEFPGGEQRFQTEAQDAELSLAALLANRGLPLNTRCGGRGWCRGCEVDVLEGRLLSEGAAAVPGSRVQACQHRVDPAQGVHVRVPLRSHLLVTPQVEQSFRMDPDFELSPPFEVSQGQRDTGFAVDIGTTTVAVLICDLSTGTSLARAGAYNAQIRFGDNVLTRIGAAADPATREALRRAIVEETIAPLLRRACERARRSPARLAGGALAGNTTMLHLLLGVDPSSLGVAPFTPRFLESRRLSVGELGLAVSDAEGALDPSCPALILPGLSAYVGADLSAGILATSMAGEHRPQLLVDIGTNGEIVLQREGRLLATATAAGPAFEGAGLRSGTRAHSGAVSKIRIREGLGGFALETIGGFPLAQSPGLCGTAFVDFLAEGRRHGLLLPNGRFDKAAWATLPEKHRAKGEGGLSVVFAGELQICEADVAQLLNAKSAVSAGLQTLLAQARIQPSEIETLHLAGGFGMNLDLGHTLAIGMLPGFRAEQINVVGNSSLAGALLAVLDKNALPTMDAYRHRTTILELNTCPGFEDCFIDNLGV